MKRVLINIFIVLIFTIVSCSKDVNILPADTMTLTDDGLYVSRTDTVIKLKDAVKLQIYFPYELGMGWRL